MTERAKQAPSVPKRGRTASGRERPGRWWARLVGWARAGRQREIELAERVLAQLDVVLTEIRSTIHEAIEQGVANGVADAERKLADAIELRRKSKSAENRINHQLRRIIQDAYGPKASVGDVEGGGGELGGPESENGELRGLPPEGGMAELEAGPVTTPMPVPAPDRHPDGRVKRPFEL